MMYLIQLVLLIITDFVLIIPDALHDLVPFVQFKKREKYPWRSVTFSKVAGFRFFKIVQIIPNRATHHI